MYITSAWRNLSHRIHAPGVHVNEEYGEDYNPEQLLVLFVYI